MAALTPEPVAASRELRLALVCYGGVSLAIYMHGVTKELHKLVSASRAFDEPSVTNPFSADDTRHWYFEALRDLADEQRGISVSVDIVAGTSAGGINGVCLAKVLACNGSQEALKELWIDRADLKTLLNAPAVLGWRTRAVLAGLKMLSHWKAPASPLRGEVMSRLLYDALDQMNGVGDGSRVPSVDGLASLIRSGGTLDLFVTATDLQGFPVLVPAGSGGASQVETNHAQVLRFRAEGGDTNLGREATAALAFAARASASFPGAFPPVSRASFAHELDGRPVDTAAIADRFQNRYALNGVTSDDAWFVDGGVLDNAPFDLAVQAIARKRAQSEVIRRLIYIQPDPGGGLLALTPPDQTQPEYLAALTAGAWSVKGSHSILRDLLALRDLNLRIAEIGTIVARQDTQVEDAIQLAWQATGPVVGAAATPPDVPTPATEIWNVESADDIQQLAHTIYDNARYFIGAVFPTYCRLKVEEIARRLAAEVSLRYEYPPDSSTSSFVHASISAWARRATKDLDPTGMSAMLGPLDIPYRERRLMFILAGVNGFYAVADAPGRPTRAQLDGLKDQAWTLLEELRTAPRVALDGMDPARTEFLSAARLDELAVFANPELFAEEHTAEFLALHDAYRVALTAHLQDSSLPMWNAFVASTAGWSLDDRKALLSRYIGFPLWDALIFPTIALSELPQFTPISVAQFSPIAARALPMENKLEGVAFHHFGGFKEAEYRENDYLWGRLDGAELILRTLRGTRTPEAFSPTPVTPQDAHARAGVRLRPALRAVLSSERDLRRIKPLRAKLDSLVNDLPEDPTSTQ
ncbi:MAG: hypothetical protein QOC66_438 [Pseudonocardiales bacterium]|nr:hypothetical protein [Pseudonocardiales bacterium]